MTENNTERELGWDDEIKNESTFELLPEGEYTYMVESFERWRYEPTPRAKLPACNMVTLSLKITGNDQSATLQHRLFLHTRCEGMLCDFFTSIGMRKHGEHRVPISLAGGQLLHCPIVDDLFLFSRQVDDKLASPPTCPTQQPTCRAPTAAIQPCAGFR